jgi:hypothetical protein
MRATAVWRTLTWRSPITDLNECSDENHLMRRHLTPCPDWLIDPAQSVQQWSSRSRVFILLGLGQKN